MIGGVDYMGGILIAVWKWMKRNSMIYIQHTKKNSVNVIDEKLGNRKFIVCLSYLSALLLSSLCVSFGFH